MATYGPKTGYDFQTSAKAVPGAFESAYGKQQKPFDPSQKKQFLTSHGYNEDEAGAMLAGGNPQQKTTIEYKPVPSVNPVKAGVGQAKKGLAISPDNLEAYRNSGQFTDDVIAEQMAQSNPHFASQLQKIRKKFAGDSAAVSAFLNLRFYGDTNYNPITNADKPKNYVAQTLDHIYQSANNVLGEGGIMQQYNRGQINPLQAVTRTAGEIYHGALTPVLDPLTDLTKGVLDATGASGLIQSGIEGVANSELGQAAAPFVQGAVESYQNSAPGNPLRDLSAVGQAGLDTLGVVGAQGTMDIGKRAIMQPLQHPINTLRHPIQSARSVLTGKAPAAKVAAAGQKRELVGPAKEAVAKGMDEKLMTFVAEQNADTRAVMGKMTEAAKEGGEVLGGTVKHKEILGGQMMDNAAYVLEKKQAVGKALGAMKAAVADDFVNLTDDYNKLLTELRNKGAVISDKGKIMSLAGASDDNIPLLQQTLDFLEPDLTGTVIKRGKEVDMWRQKMFQEMNSAKAKLQPSAAGQPVFGFAEKVTNDLRRSALVRLAGQNNNMIALNDAFEELSTQASKFLKSIQYKGRLNVEDITAKQLRAGEVALRTLGNASADSRDAFISLIQTARKYGRISNVDEMALIRYADALEDVFPITPTRSLQGAMSRGTKDALGNFTEDVIHQGPRGGVTRFAMDKLGEAVNAMRGITPENRFRLLMEVLNAPPDANFFTIANEVLPEAVADDVAPVLEAIKASSSAQ